MAISISEANEITEKYYDDIYRFFCARCKNADTAKDLTQDVFLEFAKKLHKLKNDNIRSWLYSTANNKLKEYLRKEKKQEDRECSWEYDIPEELIPDTTVNAEDFEQLLSSFEKKLFGSLTPREKQVFIYLYTHKKTPAQTAQELGISMTNLTSTNSRIKAKAKDIIAEGNFIMCFMLTKLFFGVL